MQARRARAAGAGYVPALLFPDAEVASGGSHDKVRYVLFRLHTTQVYTATSSTLHDRGAREIFMYSILWRLERTITLS